MATDIANGNAAVQSIALGATLPAGSNPVQVPRFWATTISTVGTNNELILLLGSGITVLDNEGRPSIANTPSVQISMPTIVAKELIELLTDYVAEAEKVSGKLDSAFLQARRGS